MTDYTVKYSLWKLKLLAYWVRLIVCLWFSHTLEKKSNFLGLHQNLYISHKLINEMSEDGSIFPHQRQKFGASKYILQKKKGGKIS